MTPLLPLLEEAGRAVVGMLSLPYFYIALLFVWWHAKQASTLQRQLFHVRLHSSLAVAAYRLLSGIAVGIVVSLIGLTAGGRLDETTLLCVWIAMAALAIFRLRYICLAYAAGALGIVQSILTWTGVSAADGEVAKALLGIDAAGLLFLAGVLHVAEGLLVLWQGSKHAVPLFLEGKRGKPVGSYSLSGLWPVPLLWLVPSTGADAISLPWTPLSNWDGSALGWSLAAFPVLIGFTTRTETRWPHAKARETGGGLIAYGVIVAGLAAGAWFQPELGIAASLAAFALHEGLILWSRWRESGRQPLYVQKGRGLTILAVLPGTPAAEMQLQAGERITKVNGARVNVKEQLHDALQLQSAFCRLEVVNREGEIKFVQRARYEGEHYQLGLILAPDEEAEWVAAPRSASLWQGLQRAGARRRRNAPALRAAEREAAGAASELAAGEAAEAPEATGPADAAGAAGPAGGAAAAASHEAGAGVSPQGGARDDAAAPADALPPRRARR